MSWWAETIARIPSGAFLVSGSTDADRPTTVTRRLCGHAGHVCRETLGRIFATPPGDARHEEAGDRLARLSVVRSLVRSDEIWISYTPAIWPSSRKQEVEP